jgi:hypothetical protein
LRKWRGTNYTTGSAHKCKTKNQNAAIIHSWTQDSELRVRFNVRSFSRGLSPAAHR